MGPKHLQYLQEPFWLKLFSYFWFILGYVGEFFIVEFDSTLEGIIFFCSLMLCMAGLSSLCAIKGVETYLDLEDK